MKPPKYVDCHHCGARTRPKWVKKFELPRGIALMGFGVCRKCNRPAFHIQGEPEAVADVTEDFQEFMQLGDADARPTSIATGKPWFDG